MRGDIEDLIKFIAKEDELLFNKAELARRYDCDPRTIDRYLKIDILGFTDVEPYLSKYTTTYSVLGSQGETKSYYCVNTPNNMMFD